MIQAACDELKIENLVTSVSQVIFSREEKKNLEAKEVQYVTNFFFLAIFAQFSQKTLRIVSKRNSLNHTNVNPSKKRI